MALESMMDSYLDERPKLSHLQAMHTLVPDEGEAWYGVGVALQLGDEDDGEYLEGLKPQQEEKKLFIVSKKWLQESRRSNHVLKPVTWRTYLQVLRSQKLDVKNLMDYLSKGSAATPTAVPPVGLTPPTPKTPTATACVTPPTPKTIPAAAVSATPNAPKTPATTSVTPSTVVAAAPISRAPVAGVAAGPISRAPVAGGAAPPTSLPQSIPLQHVKPAHPKVPHPETPHPKVPHLEVPHPEVLYDDQVLDLDLVSNELPESSIPFTDFTLKMADGHEVREYQRELAQPGIEGKNYIIIAPTGSGKTVVAALVISDHLQKNQLHQSCHVVFVVNTKPLAEQQKRQLDSIIPGARVEVYTGDNLGTVRDSIQQGNNISVCTAGKLLDEIRKGRVTFDQFSLMVFDECHHTRKGHPYARLMEHYLEYKEKQKRLPLIILPQIIGMTASPGAGENYDLVKKKTIDHLLKLAAILDAGGGFQTVTKNLAELQRTTKNSSCTRKILKPRNMSGDPFVDCITNEMAKLEESVPKMKNHFERWSQEYETRVQQVKQPLELVCDGTVRDAISTLNLLRCYSNALCVYMDLQQQDAITELENYRGFPEEDEKATPYERDVKHRMKALLEKLKMLRPSENPLLENMMETLRDTFHEKPTSRAILFIRTKKHAYSVQNWVFKHPELQALKPDVITGHTRETGSGMTQVEQEEVMDRFRKGQTNLLIATSVAEEGLDVPECNLVIKFQHVSNEIAQVQTEGRARAENSQGVTILSSDSRKKYRELKNMELNVLVEKILEDNHFPAGQYLKKELSKIQQEIIAHRRMKAGMRARRRQSYSSDAIKLFCKTCKGFACFGSDVHVIGDDGSHHYVVPDPAFLEKITCRDHASPRDLIRDEVRTTHRIHCTKCDREWGVKCIWPTAGHTFPVIKCAAFIFQIEGVASPVKKWSDAPFEMKKLDDWLSKNTLDDSYSSSSSDTESNSE